jgi:hypothetical protein
VKLDQWYFGYFGAELEAGPQLSTPVGVGTHWPRGDDTVWTRLSLGAAAARGIMQLPPIHIAEVKEDEPSNGNETCRPGGLGGVAWWAGAQSEPATSAALTSVAEEFKHLAEHTSITRGAFTLLQEGGWLIAEAEQGAALLKRPRGEIRQLIEQNYAKLSDPKTTLAEAAGILGVPAPSHPAHGRRCP